MAVKLREDIEELKKAINGSGNDASLDDLKDDVSDLKELISKDGNTMMLFGKVVSIDSTTGAVTLSDPIGA